MLFQLRNDTKKTGGLGLYRGFYNYYPIIWVFPKIVGKPPKMDGENKGKPYVQMDDLGGFPPIFGSTPI